MKIGLAMIMCSLYANICMDPYVMPSKYNSMYDCMLAGYEESELVASRVGRPGICATCFDRDPLSLSLTYIYIYSTSGKPNFENFLFSRLSEIILTTIQNMSCTPPKCPARHRKCTARHQNIIL